jgi:DNA transposition AAA+ family ATPase
MEECKKSSTRYPEPTCMLIMGESGAGKSTLARQYAARYPSTRTDSGAVIPVVFVTIPARATFHSLVQKMLYVLRDPAALVGSTQDKTIRLLELLRDCRVELLIMDKGNHLYDKDTGRALENTADWVKTLILDTEIGTVILGLPKTEAIIARNEQLSRRFAERHHLSPFPDGPEFRDFLAALEADLPLRERSFLSGDDMALRIHDGSDGTIGYIMRLVREATVVALDEGSERLTLELLADSFDQYIANDKPKKTNPFL